LIAGRTPYREGLLDLSDFPHAYFYGNWGLKVPIILPDQGISRDCHNPKIQLGNSREATIVA